MSTYVEARTAVVTLLNTALGAQYPTVPVFWENTTAVALDKVGERFIKVQIDFDDAQQMTVNGAPHHMTFGTLRLSIFWKEGAGTLTTLQMMDYLTGLTKYKLTGTVTFWTPAPGRKVSQDGWISQDLEVPFRFHTMGV